MFSPNPIEKSSTDIYELIIFTGNYMKRLDPEYPNSIKREGTYIL